MARTRTAARSAALIKARAGLLNDLRLRAEHECLPGTRRVLRMAPVRARSDVAAACVPQAGPLAAHRAGTHLFEHSRAVRAPEETDKIVRSRNVEASCRRLSRSHCADDGWRKNLHFLSSNADPYGREWLLEAAQVYLEQVRGRRVDPPTSAVRAIRRLRSAITGKGGVVLRQHPRREPTGCGIEA